MRIDRRTFLQWTAAAGMAVAGTPFAARRARAATDAYGGPYWLFIHAAGGWDPTLLCDPKGREREDSPEPVNSYLVDEIEEVGPFRFAPVDGHRAFFQRFRDQLLVINGIDTQTNSHEVGERFTWSGRMEPDSPALASLIAAGAAKRPSLSYLSFGGYDLTGGLVAPTRLNDTDTVLQIAYPDRLDEDDPESTLFTSGTLARLKAARDARLERQLDLATLPRVRRAMGLLQEARAGDNELARLAEVLPYNLDNSGNDLRRQAQVSIACFRAGVSVSASLSMGGFDTHGDHDDSHTPPMQDVVDAVSYAMDEAERQGIAEQLVIVVGSDFGRTPWYNDMMGKDHWSVTSMMMMGPGIRGGRVVGASDEKQSPLTVDPSTLALSETGVRITPAHVNAALRRLAGIDDWEVANRWIVGDPLPLLG